jgi:hypothetical protein
MNRAISLVALLFGCGTNHASAIDQTHLFPDRCPDSECSGGATVTQASALVALIDATTQWTIYGPYTTGCLPASPDIVITEPVTVDANALALPADCTTPGCRQNVTFVIEDVPAGVTCLQPRVGFDYTECGGITLQDVTVRLRMIERDIHPDPSGPFAPIVEVLPACASACATDEFSCGATHTCWSSPRDQCAYCFAGSNEVCACWDGEGLLPDGTSCQLQPSNDTVELGTCRAGQCVLNK